MKIIKAGYEIQTDISEDGIKELQAIERAARTCYKSEDKITEDGESAKKMVRGLIKSGHEAMLEHGGMTVKFIVDRGVSHEIVRHRLFSFAQESTRYCSYDKDKFGNEITVIEPCFWDHSLDENGNHADARYNDWLAVCEAAEGYYIHMLGWGATPQEARSVLPNSLKTEIVVTGNWREWRHFLKLRSAPDAHPQIREVAIPLLNELHEKIPVLFDDIYDNVFQKKIKIKID